MIVVKNTKTQKDEYLYKLNCIRLNLHIIRFDKIPKKKTALLTSTSLVIKNNIIYIQP